MATWEAKETSIVRGQEKKKKKVPWALQIPIRSAELVSSAVLDAKLLRLYTDENHGNVYDGCLLQWKTTTPQNLLVPQSAPPVSVSDTCSVAASKSQLDWSTRSHVWWSVSCCQGCISLQGMRYRNRRALSGWTESEGVAFCSQENSQTASECSNLTVNERHNVFLCLQSLAAETWKDRDTLSEGGVLKRKVAWHCRWKWWVMVEKINLKIVTRTT